MDVRFTRVRVATAALFVLAGIGLASLLSPLVGTALATVGQTVNISDHSSSAFFAKVDSGGKLLVGDGGGPLSVDGTVASRPAAPGSPWHASQQIQNSGTFIAGPSALPINVTSLSISTDAASGSGISVFLIAYHVPSSATSCDVPGLVFDATLWQLRDAGDGVTPLSFTFPTALQFKAPGAPGNTKACLAAQAPTPALTIMNAVGFYGG
jgi:hypothetical protein